MRGMYTIYTSQDKVKGIKFSVEKYDQNLIYKEQELKLTRDINKIKRDKTTTKESA